MWTPQKSGNFYSSHRVSFPNMHNSCMLIAIYSFAFDFWLRSIISCFLGDYLRNYLWYIGAVLFDFFVLEVILAVSWYTVRILSSKIQEIKVYNPYGPYNNIIRMWSCVCICWIEIKPVKILSNYWNLINMK